MMPWHSGCRKRRRQIEQIARDVRRGLAAPLAQIISFGIVCAVLYRFAYKPILKILEARRQQIAERPRQRREDQGRAGRIEIERHDVLTKAGDDGKQLIEEARAAAARVQAEETRKATAAAEQILVRAHEATEPSAPGCSRN